MLLRLLFEQQGTGLRSVARSLLLGREVADDGVGVLQQVLVLERVGLVGHFLEAFGSDLGPKVARLILHEEAVLFNRVDRGPQLRIALEYLVQQIASHYVDPLPVQLDLTREDLLLNLHRVVFVEEGQRSVTNKRKNKLLILIQAPIRRPVCR